MDELSNKDFCFERAYNLLCYYEKKRYFSRAKFMSELIRYQKSFGAKSIFSCNSLLFSGHYRERTIKLALHDLNCPLNTMFVLNTYNKLLGIKYNKFTVIIFSASEGN